MSKRIAFVVALLGACLLRPQQLAPPAKVQNISIQYRGGVGSNTYFYWIVARYPFGVSGPSGPVSIASIATLSSSNVITIGWSAISGATYDVLRKTNSVTPSGACNCAVAKFSTSNSFTDRGDPLLTYTVDTSGVKFPDDTIQTTSGSGAVTAVTGTVPIASSGGATPAISIADFAASGVSHARGAVPDPGVVGGTTKFLREDATWNVPAGGNTTSTGTFAALPITCTNGDVYFPNDSYYVFRCASNTWIPWGPVFPLTRVPAISNFTWVNQGSATATELGGIFIAAPADAANSVHLLKEAAPATPWTLTALFLVRDMDSQTNDLGLAWRESSTGKLVTCRYVVVAANTHIYITKYNSPISENSTYENTIIRQGSATANPFFLRITDNGTDRTCSWGMDGQNFRQVHTIGRTDFLTADEVGFYVNPQHASSPVAVTVVSWKR